MSYVSGAPSFTSSIRKLFVTLLLMVLWLTVCVLYDLKITIGVYLPLDFIGIEQHWLNLGLLATGGAIFLCVIRRSILPINILVWYFFGWGDILFYWILGYFPERFWNVWIAGLFEFSPLASHVFMLGVTGVIYTIGIILLWSPDNNGCLLGKFIRSFKKIDPPHVESYNMLNGNRHMAGDYERKDWI